MGLEAGRRFATAAAQPRHSPREASHSMVVTVLAAMLGVVATAATQATHAAAAAVDAAAAGAALVATEEAECWPWAALSLHGTL